MILDIALIVFLFMTVAFILALIKKDNSIVDILWGIGFILIMIYSLIQSGEVDLRKMVVGLLVLLWGLRLSHHIMMRNAGRGEDPRYEHWRDTWKFFIVRSFFQVYMLQGLVMLLVSTPIWFINLHSAGLPGIWDLIGLMIFGTGFMTETIADYQLTVFKKNPENSGKILTTGLWSISRHPNYFGEALVWWGISFYALGLHNGWYTLVSPVVMTLLLRFVSGVPMIEKRYKGRPDWEDYKAKTPPFVPYIKGL